jgi:hypothetical protein
MTENTENTENQRVSLRRRTIFGGVIYEDNSRSTECSVSDISETGAKIRANLTLKIGDEVDLKINKFNDLRRCSVAWIREGAIGLHFLVPITSKNEDMARLFKFSNHKSM